MLDKLEVSTMQYEPAVIQANDNPPSREISYKAILSKVCTIIVSPIYDSLLR